MTLIVSEKATDGAEVTNNNNDNTGAFDHKSKYKVIPLPAGQIGNLTAWKRLSFTSLVSNQSHEVNLTNHMNQVNPVNQVNEVGVYEAAVEEVEVGHLSVSNMPSPTPVPNSNPNLDPCVGCIV